MDYRPAGCNDQGIRGNCGVVTLAAILGADYHQTENEFRQMFIRRDNWKGSTSVYERVKFLRSKGRTVENIKAPRETVRRACARLDPAQTYMIRTGGHAMALINGKLVDQNGTWEPSHPLRARKIVSKVHKITEE